MSLQPSVESKIVMVFDTETTGLPMKRPGSKFSNYRDTELYNNCRLVQYSGIIYDFEKSETLHEFDYIVKPDGFIINNSNIHGITMEIANRDGIKITNLFEHIIAVFKKYNIGKIVGHNVSFDLNVIKSEMFRYMRKNQLVNFPILRAFEKVPYFCTMKNTVDICKLPNPNFPNKFKYPKLSELYKNIFNKEAVDLHNSMNDAIYTLDCLIDLYNYDLIKLF